MPDGPLFTPLRLEALIADVAGRYAGASRFTRGFVPSKLKRDPATAAILAHAQRVGGLGHVLDLGCGRGQLGLALLLSGGASRITGMDIDAVKVAEAGEAAQGLPARFEQADLSRAALPEVDTALMADVLYQLPDGCQVEVLDRMARAARRRVVMRLFDPDLGWRSNLGMVMERARRAISREGTAVAPMPVPQVVARFEAAGFRCTVVPCWAGTPLPNVLMLAERGGA
ncbi:methyltransferase domain-containing protein [Roseomonas sp. SSH11]|uniref:Methyltransferase domain-containing protein n=1 Tax=Pararoseomonas baculiformis TaxID=2820812 RepID=A0ABS4ACQ7_9PROT|nr:class I SAM-dependent methyltransferase [Pararoseomonas baculiformis]MBP0444780.1 methyltransferase domain-containing protein [Pararoseomonas baculiformis]